MDSASETGLIAHGEGLGGDAVRGKCLIAHGEESDRDAVRRRGLITHEEAQTGMRCVEEAL